MKILIAADVQHNSSSATQTLWDKTLTDPTAIATFALASFTFLLALATFGAIIIPILSKRRADEREQLQARRELVSLLVALEKSLGNSVREPAWPASAGIDIVVSKILQTDILSALEPFMAERVVESVMESQRALHNAELRNQATQSQNFSGVKNTANEALQKLAALREQINAL